MLNIINELEYVLQSQYKISATNAKLDVLKLSIETGWGYPNILNFSVNANNNELELQSKQ